MSSTKEIVEHLKSLGKNSDKKQLQRFFKTGKGQYGEGDIFIGIRVPKIRKLVPKYKNVSIKKVKELISSPFHEVRLFALFVLVRKFDKAEKKQQKEVFDFYLANTRFINNWDLVDLSAPNIVGKYLLDKDRTPLLILANSENLWEKRIAMLACYTFIKNGEFDTALQIADILRYDTHDLIHKAVGWMLREIGNRDLAVEEAFLKKCYNTLPRTLLRYAIEKFDEASRQDYLKGRI